MTDTAKVLTVRFKTGVPLALPGIVDGLGTILVGKRSIRVPQALVRIGLSALPERFLLRRAAKQFGGGDLGALFEEAYQGIGKAAEFKGVPSAKSFCLSGKTHRQGHAFIYQPAQVSGPLATVVCLHGFGGNYLFYPWSLLAGVSDCLLVFPSWGVNYGDPAHNSGTIHTYVQDCLAHVRDHLGIAHAKPWLLAVSAGGHVGSRVSSEHTSSYAGYVSLSSTLVEGGDFAAGYPVLSLHGMEDTCFPCDQEALRCKALRERGVRAECKVWSPASHWLLISHRREICQAIRQFTGMAPAQ